MIDDFLVSLAKSFFEKADFCLTSNAGQPLFFLGQSNTTIFREKKTPKRLLIQQILPLDNYERAGLKNSECHM